MKEVSVLGKDGTQPTGRTSFRRLVSKSWDDLLLIIQTTFKNRGFTRIFSSTGSESMALQILCVAVFKLFSSKKGDDENNLRPVPCATNNVVNNSNGERHWVKLDVDGSRTVYMPYEMLKCITETAPSGIMSKWYPKCLSSSEVLEDSSREQSPKTTTNEDVSPEVLKRMLEFLPTTDLLRLRSVSHLWNKTCSLLCRERLVRLRSSWEAGTTVLTGDIYKLFGMENLPWSSYVFETYPHLYGPDPDEAIMDRRRRFLRKYGSHLWDVKFKGKNSWDVILQVLQSSPNLIRLDAQLEERLSTKETEPLQLKLSKLTHLTMTTYGLRLLEFLGNHADLTHLNIVSISSDYRRLRKLVSLIPRISHVSIWIQQPMSMQVYAVLASTTIKLSNVELKLHLPDPQRDSRSDFYLPAEQFLFKCEGLEKLDLSYFVTHAGIRLLPFKFPVLSRLEFLRICYEHQQLDRIHPGPCKNHISPSDFFALLRGNQFPVLKQVWIESRDGARSVRSCSEKLTLFGPTGLSRIHFDSVTELCVYAPLEDDWSQVFPNLRKLDIRIRKDTQLIPHILRNTKLEHLIMDVEFSRLNRDDLCEMLFEPNADFQHTTRFRQSPASTILTLKGLKTMTVDLTNAGDTGNVCLSNENGYLLQIQVLDNLTLSGSGLVISTKYQDKLRAYHKNYISY